MTRVKKELEFLKNKAEEVAGKLVNDDAVTALQSQIKQFQNEAIKLDSILDEQKREFQKLKNRKNNLVDDNEFLKVQCKEAMKHNKLLEVGLTKTKKQSDALSEFLRRNKLPRD